MSSGTAGTGGGQQALERLSLGVAGAAALVYLLHSLPTILFPSGLLASVLTLLAGVLLGLAAGGAALAFAFYQLTHPKPSRSHAPHAGEPLQPQRTRRRRAAGGGDATTAPGPTLPHAIAISGQFSGVVYTAPASAWRRSDTVASWPPTCDPSQPFKAWEATLAQGTLVLRPIVPPPGAKLASPPRGSAAAALKQPAQPADSAAAAGSAEVQPGAALSADDAVAASAALTAAPTKVGIPLEGCTLELVADGLNGRSEYIRRAPLLLSHMKWPLLEGERAFYLWADDPASKQQWTHALGWWCQDGEKLAAIQAMYSAYCDAMRDRTVLEYAEHAPQWGNGSGARHMTAAAGEGSAGPTGVEEASRALQAATGSQRHLAAPGERKKGLHALGAKLGHWKRKVDGRRRGSSSQDGGGEPGGASPAKPGTGGSSLPPSASPSPAKAQQGRQVQQLPADLASLDAIMEARWTQSRKIQMPPSIPEVVMSQSRGSSRATSPKAIPRPPSLSAASEAGAGVAGSLGGSDSLAGSFAESGMLTPPSGGSPAVAAGLHPVRRAETSPAQLGTGAGAVGSPAQLPPAGALQQQAEAEEVGGSAASAAASPGAAALQQPAATAGAQQKKGGSVAGAAPAALPPGLPPLLSPDYAVNAFVARVAFDVLRRPDFQEHLRARIQRQLSRLQRPDFIQTLEVVGVDAGGAAPSLRNLWALPQPGAAIWPQLLFDLRYQGAFTVTIEMKVDIRDAAAWGRLDQALTRLAEGRRRGSSAAGGLSGERTGGTPPHAASAPALRGGGSGGSGGSPGRGEDALEEMLLEGAEFEQPLSPQSSTGLPSLAEGADDADAAGSQQQQEGSEGSGRAGRLGIMGGIRQSAARKLRQLAESTAVQIARIPLRLSLTFSLLEGTMCAWLPPPPGNRLFYSFVTPPALEVTASPELGGRLLKYSYHVARVSSWIEHRMRTAIMRNMVFPGGGDLVLPQLLDLSDFNSADALPALGRYMQQQQQQQQQTASEPLPRRQQQEPAKQAAAAAQQGQQAAAAAQQGQQAAAAAQQGQPQQAVEAEGLEGGEDVAVAPPGVGAAGTAASWDVAAPPPAQAPASEASGEGSPAGAPETPAAEPAAALQQGAGLAPAVAAQQAPKNGGDVPAAAGASVGTAEPLAGLVAGAAGTGGLGLAAARSSSSGGGGPGELFAEPSLSLRQLLGSPAAAPTAAATPPGPADEQEPARGAVMNGISGNGGEQGHLISPRYDKRGEGGSGRARPGPASPEFRGWVAPVAAAPAAGEGRTRTAADAWDAAMAQEAAGEAPTPRFAGHLWHQAPAAAQQAAAPAAPLASSLHLLPAGQVQSSAGEEDGPVRRPALQLKLSATRSLDPDFTRSAEHTGFGESPAHALPNYGGSSVRRTLSARVDGGGGSGSAGPSSARGSGRAAVQDSLNRSLAYLRRQSSGQRPREPVAQVQHAEPAGGTAAPASPQQQQQHEAAQPSASSPPQHSSSPPGSEGGFSGSGDPRRLRQQGSIKEQAGKLFTRMVREGKALASQVQQMQQQRAVARSQSSPGHSGASPPHQ